MGPSPYGHRSTLSWWSPPPALRADTRTPAVPDRSWLAEAPLVHSSTSRRPQNGLSRLVAQGDEQVQEGCAGSSLAIGMLLLTPGHRLLSGRRRRAAVLAQFS